MCIHHFTFFFCLVMPTNLPLTWAPHVLLTHWSATPPLGGALSNPSPSRHPLPSVGSMETRPLHSPRQPCPEAQASCSSTGRTSPSKGLKAFAPLSAFGTCPPPDVAASWKSHTGLQVGFVRFMTFVLQVWTGDMTSGQWQLMSFLANLEEGSGGTQACPCVTK